MTTKIKFKDKYSSIGKKGDEFVTKYSENAEDMTDQSQVVSASIVEMAKRFGIDAIIAKAEQKVVENQAILDQLYGHDYTKMFTNKESMLNAKNKLNTIFEKLPARIRKEYFNDNVTEFVDAYTYNDERKLEQLNKLGIVSNTQLEEVKGYNKKIKLEKEEQIKKQQFIEKLSEQQGALYEKFKETGNIIFDNNKINTGVSKDVQTDIQ